MFEIDIPGYGFLRLEHLVMDYNGMLAQDGKLLEGVARRFEKLEGIMELHVVTADTFGQAKDNLNGISCKVVILPARDQAQRKLAYVEDLGQKQVVAIGNGRNDRLMLAGAELAIAVLQDEGVAFEALAAADVIMPHIRAALDALLFPERLIATLRS